MCCPAILTALRAGRYSHIVLSARWRDGEPTESAIVAYRDRDAGEHEQVARLEAASWIEFGDGLLRRHEHVRASALLMSPQHHALWQTFLHLARPSDEVIIAWSANGQRNLHLARANLNIDTCALEVRRGQRRLRFHLATVVTRSDTSRMFTAGDRHFCPIIDPPETL